MQAATKEHSCKPVYHLSFFLDPLKASPESSFARVGASSVAHFGKSEQGQGRSYAGTKAIRKAHFLRSGSQVAKAYAIVPRGCILNCMYTTRLALLRMLVMRCS